MEMKYSENMSLNDISMNARLIDKYFSGIGKRNWSGLRMILSWPDRTFWVDGDGNIWEEVIE